MVKIKNIVIILRQVWNRPHWISKGYSHSSFQWKKGAEIA